MSEVRTMVDDMRNAADQAAADAEMLAWDEVPNAADVVAAMLAATGENEVFLPSDSLPFDPVRLYWRLAKNDEGEVGLLVRAVHLTPADAAVGRPS